jgi:hypothetical protein
VFEERCAVVFDVTLKNALCCLSSLKNSTRESIVEHCAAYLFLIVFGVVRKVLID